MRPTAPILLAVVAAGLALAAPGARAGTPPVGQGFVIAEGEMLHDEVMAARAAVESHHMRQAMAHLDRAETMLHDAAMSADARDRAMQDLESAKRMIGQGDMKGAVAAIDAVMAHAGGQG